jgi:hypothetical protein
MKLPVIRVDPLHARLGATCSLEAGRSEGIHRTSAYVNGKGDIFHSL